VQGEALGGDSHNHNPTHWSAAATGCVLHLWEHHHRCTGAPLGESERRERETRRIHTEKKIKI
jgi:hypothetical protein